jgi:hypothetical protein
MAEIFKFPEPKSDPMQELEKIMYGWAVMSNHQKEMKQYAELKSQIDDK